MSLSPGARIGPYEVTAVLGAGGMGQVYRARDTGLGRDVALKVLPDALAADADRLMRFEREAKMLAALNHPNIAQVFGLEPLPSDGSPASSRAIVMELVEGEDLAACLTRGPLPIDEALPIARQIADALEAAHDHGIIHRDLKPANIRLRRDGVAKVLDFGLAKPLTGDSPSAAHEATVTSPALTTLGVILGTAAYMSPEQAKGRPVDRRTDIWAFGCVLYEMLTARRAFPGDDVSDTLVSILSRPPDWSAVPPATPAAVVRLLRRCLEKDRTKRLGDVHDARLELDDAEPGAAPSPVRRRPLALWAATAATGVVAIALGWLGGARTARLPDAALETRMDIGTPPTLDLIGAQSIELSPDGRKLAVIGLSDGRSRLFVRDFGAEAATPLAGTDGATFPFWSPDGRALGFFANGKLRRIELTTGSVVELADSTSGRGGTWGRDGTIVFAPTGPGPLMKVSSQGGTVTPVTKVSSSQESHQSPRFVAAGRQFVFTNVPLAGGEPSLMLADLDGSAPARLAEGSSQAAWVAPDWLVFQRGGVLQADRVDLSRRTLAGKPITIATGLNVANIGSRAFSAAAGTVAFRRVGEPQNRLVWFDRSGAAAGTVGGPGPHGFPALSPNGRWVAEERPGAGVDVWLVDVRDGTERRLTFDEGNEGRPVWASDSRAVYYTNLNGRRPGIWRKAIDTDAPPAPVLEGSGLVLDAISADGQQLAFRQTNGRGHFDLFVLPLRAGATPQRLFESPATEAHAQLSPDGRWVAYSSDESGRFEVYVRRASSTGTDRLQVSTGGGAMPKWAPSQRELFYVTLDGVMRAVPVKLGDSTVDFGPQTTLYSTQIPPFFITTAQSRTWYDVSADGRFLMGVQTFTPPPIVVVLNWAPSARPTGGEAK